MTRVWLLAGSLSAAPADVVAGGNGQGGPQRGLPLGVVGEPYAMSARLNHQARLRVTSSSNSIASLYACRPLASAIVGRRPRPVPPASAVRSDHRSPAAGVGSRSMSSRASATSFRAFSRSSRAVARVAKFFRGRTSSHSPAVHSFRATSSRMISRIRSSPGRR